MTRQGLELDDGQVFEGRVHPMTATDGVPSTEAVATVLLAAAEIVRTLYRDGSVPIRKPDNSLVTEADRRANEFLRRGLCRLVPHAGWLSEESADDSSRLSHDWVWIVDPLDGTKEFVAGVDEFTVSVGLAYRGIAVLGAVVNPATGEASVGGPGIAPRFWGFDPSRTPPTTLDDAIASVSASEVRDGTVLPCLSLVGRTAPMGSAAYKLLRVAAAADDLTFSVQHKSEWDVCGGVALLTAAGRVYRRFDGTAMRFNQSSTRIRCGAVAGPTLLVEQFMDAMHRHGLLHRAEV